MKEEKFISSNSHLWKELEAFSTKIDKKGISHLSSEEVRRFLHVFRQCSHHLAYSRTHYSGSNTSLYLNSLLSKCHSHVYAVKKVSPGYPLKYIGIIFPKLLRKFKWYVLASFAFFLLGAIVSFISVFYDTSNATLFLPSSVLSGAKSSGSHASNWNYPLMSSTIMINNITVALRAFVFGITLGLGTIYVLFYNGLTLGALTALMYRNGDVIRYWSLILPHGIIELTAIFISGAAGLIIAKSILLPGIYSRKHSIVKGSKDAVSLIGGVIFLLVIAGTIEGFFTPLNISPIVKLFFAGVTFVLLAAYFSLAYVIKNKN